MRREEIAALAVDAFDKFERVRMLGMCNTPTGIDERRKAAVEYAIARAKAHEAQKKLDTAIGAKP